MLNVAFARMYHRIAVRTPLRIPRRGPALLVCNHTSGLDPLLLQAVSPRLIRWMMAREYYEVSPLRMFFKIVGAIPVERSGRDLAATRAAFRALQAGYVVGVFPEGRIETSCELLPFQNGVALLAARSGVPIHPAYLDGTQRGKEMLPAVLTRNEATISFGEPLIIRPIDGGRAELDLQTARVQDAVEQLRQLEMTQ
jgi:1-acyl-sn-glycerol-3-phosphate acyltransferase